MIGVARVPAVGLLPLNAIRHPPVGTTNGWYIWRGKVNLQEAGNDLFVANHLKHAAADFPELVPYLALPPGWGVLLAPAYEDVWYDPALLEP
jgi:hypothetical protein